MSFKIKKKLISRILHLSEQSKEGHIPSCLSILDILISVYDHININKIKLELEDRDFFILSKGHGALALYVILEFYNFYKRDILNNFCKYDSKFGGHPDASKIKGVEMSTGSLGHGMPFAAGVAYAKKIKNLKGDVICLIGDGECNEGTIWESCLLINHHKLNNLTCILDNNLSSSRSLDLKNIKKKFESFGFETFNVDGHDPKKIKKILKKKNRSPKMIIANTIKGKGVKIMENNPEWHHKSINKEFILKHFK